MISGCGFPNKEGNYEGALFSFMKMFGEGERILCVEAPMLSIPDAAPLTEQYLADVRRAGHEYVTNGFISEETHQCLDRAMLDPEEYRKMCSGM